MASNHHPSNGVSGGHSDEKLASSVAPATSATTVATTVAEEPPPLLGSWNRMYAVVLLTFVALVLCFYALTRMYS